MESLTFFGVSVEYFGVFEVIFVNLRSFHFGDTVECSFSAVSSYGVFLIRMCVTHKVTMLIITKIPPKMAAAPLKFVGVLVTTPIIPIMIPNKVAGRTPLTGEV